MTKAFLASPKRVEINGVDVQHLLNVSIDRLEQRAQTLDCLDYHHTLEVHFGEYAEGTIEFAPTDRRYANDPATALDVLGFALGHLEYDTTNEEVVMSYDNMDSGLTSGNLASYPRVVELRQTHASASHAISDDGSDDEAWAQSFPAAGEDIYKIKVKVYQSAGTPVESFDIELWEDDGAGAPDAKLAGTNTVTVYATSGSDSATTYYLGHALTSGTTYNDAVWETVDFSGVTNLLGTASMTIGTTYWLVFRNVQTSGDDMFFAYTTTDFYEGGAAKQDDDVGDSPLWGDAPANTKDLTIIIQCYTSDGLQIDIYDYATSTTGLHYTFKKVKCTSGSGLSASPMQVAQGSLKWTSEDVVITTI